MEKFCVFCGEKPQLKNNEHIIPMWLIEITGNPKRIAQFGYNQDLSKIPRARTFSFNAFKFPSCATCNQKYSNLEMTVKSIINRILSDDSISSWIHSSILTDTPPVSRRPLPALTHPFLPCQLYA